MTRHKQVRRTYSGQLGPKRRVSVDAGIADLIVACWKAGLETVMSCEDTGSNNAYAPDCVWVAFLSREDVDTFLYRAIGDITESTLPEGWHTRHRHWGGPLWLRSVWFPTAEYERVLARFVEGATDGTL